MLAALSYPLVMALALGLHLAIAALDAPVAASAYLPVAAAALAVIGLERCRPHRRDWRPTRGEVAGDAGFMLGVQVLLPKCLALLALLALAPEPAGGPSAPWPHHWPPALQAALMLLAADFLRYWLHRAAHRHPALWALHGVHHAPRLLYWFNVGRFHPLDKALQLCLDTLPFLLLGVSDTVLSLYFVVYAVNGFIQHSNVEMKLGVLNYVISGPELHRWHHAADPRLGGCNFGNNLIVWDLVFGTWYLPPRPVGEVGIRPGPAAPGAGAQGQP